MMETDLLGLIEDNLCSRTEKTKGDGSKQLLFYLLILLSHRKMKARGKPVAAQQWERVRARWLFPYELCTPAVVTFKERCGVPFPGSPPPGACLHSSTAAAL